MSQHLSLPELPEVLYNPQTSNCLVPAASRELKAPTHLHLQHTDVIVLHLVGDQSVQAWIGSEDMTGESIDITEC